MKPYKPPHVRKVIDGFIYDTAKAQLVAVKKVGSPDWGMSDECLYRTAKGNWFFALETLITPLKVNEAQHWLKDDPDLYVQFWPVEEA